MNKEGLDCIDENAIIQRIASRLPRSTYNVNRLHESDAELLDIGLESQYLALSTDVVSEEISEGLYTDPHLMGWMAIVVNLSDLAAVGAWPVGVLLSTTLSSEWDGRAIDRVADGMADACRAHYCGLLGGDLNEGHPALGATAVGLVAKDRVMTRTNMQDGDRLYLTGPVGLGGAYALARVTRSQLMAEEEFQPVARIREAQVISKYASACMDTSDGLLFSVDQLFRLNAASIHLDDPKGLLHPAASRLVESYGLSPLTLLAVVHGEFELCFTVPEAEEEIFLEEMAANGHAAVPAGRVEMGARAERGVFVGGGKFPSGRVRNLWTRSRSKEEYMQGLLALIAEFSHGGG